MNLRRITLKYMGWCPGMKSAARFVPDKDIPPTRMVLFIALFGSVAITSYIIVQRSLVFFGVPSPTTVNVDNSKPGLIVMEDSLFLAMEVEIGDGFEIFSTRQVCLVQISTEGQILDINAILDLRRAFLASMDIIVTTDGKWHMVYQQYRIGGTYYLDNDLKYIYSDDGENWEKPVVVSKGGLHSPHSIDISLTEVGNGEIILCYRKWNKEIEDETVYYSTYRPKEGWETPKETSFNWYGVSSFLDKDGAVAIVGGPYPEESLISIDGGAYLFGMWSSTYVARMKEEGKWDEPLVLNYGGGIRAKIFPSQIRDGYFIVTNGIGGDRWVQLTFSDDLESWDPPITFGDAQKPTFAELPNGVLVLVFERSFEPPPGVSGEVWTELFISTSRDGSSWSTPSKLETIMDEKGVESMLSNRRSAASVIASIPTAVLVILLLYKKKGPVSGKLNFRSNNSGFTP